MISKNGHEWKTLSDDIMHGDKKIIAVYVGDKLVYPVDYRLRYAMWFDFDYVVSDYDTHPVNQYGVYLKYDEREKPIYKVACYLNITTTPYRRSLFVALENFSTANYNLTYVPYVADGERIIADGTTNVDITTYRLSYFIGSGNKVYYRTNGNSDDYGSIGVNLRDDKGNYLLDYRKSRSSVNCPVFHSGQACINYILS